MNLHISELYFTEFIGPISEKNNLYQAIWTFKIESEGLENISSEKK